MSRLCSGKNCPIIEDLNRIRDLVKENASREALLYQLQIMEENIKYNTRDCNKDKKQKELNFCDDCIHFKPTDDPETPIKKLCEFNRDLSFKYMSDYDFNNWGFYFIGCKDFKKDNNL